MFFTPNAPACSRIASDIFGVGPADVTRAVKAVGPIVRDPDERFSLEAAKSLGKWGAASFSAVQAQLVAAASVPEAKTRRAAAVAWATFANRGETSDVLGQSARKLLQDEPPIVREAAIEAAGEWLFAKFRSPNNPGEMLAKLLIELQSDSSLFEACYRASVAYALSRAQKHLNNASIPENSVALNECRAELNRLREPSGELWLRSGAFEASQ